MKNSTLLSRHRKISVSRSNINFTGNNYLTGDTKMNSKHRPLEREDGLEREDEEKNTAEVL